MRTVSVLVAAATLLTLVGCAAPAAETPGADPAEFVGTWTPEESFDSPEQPYIELADDGSWMASDGCNTVEGTWELAADGSVATTAGPSTRIGCDGAPLPAVMAQATRLDVDGDRLRIVSDSGETVLVRTDDAAIGGPPSPVGDWVGEGGADAPVLSIAADGTFSGDDGCNAFSGAWQPEAGAGIMFSDTVSTLKLCHGVDTWLSAAARARVLDGVLSIEDSAGVVLGELVRQ